MEADQFATSKLEQFKQRMRISTTDENELSNLTEMLTNSYLAITRLVGVDEASDPSIVELVFERARYVYNDALDEFAQNYRDEIYQRYLANKSAQNNDNTKDEQA